MGTTSTRASSSRICAHLTADPPQSFFLFAGAGSGKTRTLIEVLRRLTGRHPDHLPGLVFARRLRARAQTIRVITYTNNAVDVIRGRLGNNSLVSVSTIHSFAWDLIQGFDEDIRVRLRAELQRKLGEARDEAQTRKKGPTAKDRTRIERLEERLTELGGIAHFTYSPDRRTLGEGALQHAQVLQLAADLLTSKPTLAQVLRDRHPVILIDESQDTMRGMLDALRTVVERPGRPMSLGLLGDHRQRIYMDGHQDLPAAVPAAWARPALRMNHRSTKRIVRLINRIWATELPGRTQSASGGEQYARSESAEGFVRLFVGRASTEDKVTQERACASRMAEITGDQAWTDHESGYRVLALEHKLAARRAGFYALATALEMVDKDATWERGEAKDGSDGGPSALRVFMNSIASVQGCLRPDGTLDGFAAMDLLQRHGRLRNLANISAMKQQERLRELHAAVKAVTSCFKSGQGPTLRELLVPVIQHDLFDVHERLSEALIEDEQPDRASEDSVSEGWRAVLDRPWSELAQYRAYLADRLSFGTHQGVKGSEFRNVQVILDDSEAGGFLFSYDKLFGAKALSKTDLENAAGGKETTIDRTLRLLYVTCSRPQESLAIIYWTEDPDAAIAAIQGGDWFDQGEIVRIEDICDDA